jgi:hypothetical protein
MPEFVAEGPKPNKALAFLPRTRGRDQDGAPYPPIVTIDMRIGKRSAGCCICNVPIPPETTRIEFNVALPTPVNGRTHEKFYAHSGCLTEMVRPEILRSRMSCYDCGAEPPQMSGHGLIYWGNRCFTVSKFASASICNNCITKSRWKFCDACGVYFPHWMVSETAGAKESVPAAHMAQYFDLAIREHQNVCEYCAARLGVPTMAEQVEAEKSFEKLRAEIAEHGIFEAGDDH